MTVHRTGGATEGARKKAVSLLDRHLVDMNRRPEWERDGETRAGTHPSFGFAALEEILTVVSMPGEATLDTLTPLPGRLAAPSPSSVMDRHVMGVANMRLAVAPRCMLEHAPCTWYPTSVGHVLHGGVLGPPGTNRLEAGSTLTRI